MHVAYHVVFGVICSFTLPFDFRLDAFADGEFTRTLTNLCQIGTAETLCVLSEEVEIDVLGDGRFTQVRFEDRDAGEVVRQRNVDELIEATRS